VGLGVGPEVGGGVVWVGVGLGTDCRGAAGAVARDRARGAVGSVDAPIPTGPVVGGAAVGDGVTLRTTAGGAPPAGDRASSGSIAPTTAR